MDKNVYKTITKKQKLNDMVYGLIEEYTKGKEWKT